MTFSIRSQAAPRNIGFNRVWNDQIHHITVIIPRSYYSDGRLKIMFQVRVNESDINNESGGFDNVKIIAKYSCSSPSPTPHPTPSGCTPTQRRIVTETFESSASAGPWTYGRREHDAAFSWFLGRYDVTDKNANRHPFREFAGINRSANQLKIELDFYEIDSWNNSRPNGPDCVYVHIDSRRIFMGFFGSTTDEGHRRGSNGGITWTSDSAAAPSHLGFNRNFKDQKHKFIFIVPARYFSDGKIKLTLETVVSGTKDDESSGWDNIKIDELYQCNRRLGATEDEFQESNNVFAEQGSEESTDNAHESGRRVGHHLRG